MWLPLALADITALLVELVRMWAVNPGDVTIPTRAGVLKSWALPIMASSLKAQEKQIEAEEKRKKVEALQAYLHDIQEKYGVKPDTP